jgi:subtilase family serine protease
MDRAVFGGGLALLLPGLLWPQQPPRVNGPIVDGRRVVLKGSVRAPARPEFDVGPAEPGRQIGPVVILLKQSAEQQSALAKLLDDQADRASSLYRQWLTPEQYAGRFGAAKDDIAVIGSWLASYGLKLETPARGRGWVAFSGAAGDIQTALGTEIHRYRIGFAEHFANATPISIPEALEPVVGAFMGLDDFSVHPRPLYNNSDGSHALAPGDIVTIYDIAPLHAAGIDGTGQKIVIVGDSAIDLNDLRTFRAMFDLPPNDPQLVLFGPDPGVNIDLGEADEDLEWSGAVAPNATIVYAYAANGAFEAAIYAVDQNLAPVMSMSYMSCEEEAVELAGPFRAIAQQANAQGMTWMNANGDAGAAGCDRQVVNPIATRGLAVSFPSSLPEITAMGGTEFDEGSGNYWSGTNAPGGSSALSYIPETAWNDTGALGYLSAGGGGRSIVYPKPAWQNAPGVPDDNFRDVPDVSLAASWYHDAYWLCTGGGCGEWTGGTSAASPLFAGIVALINQQLLAHKVVAQPGLGNINPVLYRMARNTTDVFHDITAGNNMVPCLAGTTGCVNGELGYNAGPGYDLATGLGSVDALHLVNEWDTRAPVTMTIGGYAPSLSLSDSTPITATVTAPSGGSLQPAL